MDYVVALLPSIGLGLLFVVIMRAILLADRRERAAVAKLEEAQKAQSFIAQRDKGDADN